jgi:hypothetical protein
VCGIVGVFDNSGHLPSAERFATSLDRLQWRGPDDSGLWSNGLVRLGHRRLAILDLSPAGHQPMVSADGRHVIVFNGEIYNHAELRPQLAPVGPRRRLSQSLSRKNAAYQRSTRCASALVGGPDAAVLRSTPRAWRGTTSGSHTTRGVIRGGRDVECDQGCGDACRIRQPLFLSRSIGDEPDVIGPGIPTRGARSAGRCHHLPAVI